MYMWGVAKSKFTGQQPEGLSGYRMWNPGFEAAVWVGGSHGAGLETISYNLSWFWSVECEVIQQAWISSWVVWWAGKRKWERQRSDCCVRRGWFPPKRDACMDHSHVTKTTLFASIAPLSAETINICLNHNLSYPYRPRSNKLVTWEEDFCCLLVSWASSIHQVHPLFGFLSIPDVYFPGTCQTEISLPLINCASLWLKS